MVGTFVTCIRSLPELVPRTHSPYWWDEQCNVDTAGMANIGDLRICPGGNDLSANMYMAIEPALFRMAMEALPGTVEGCSFIDYGSGKGRALLLASHYPFAEILGVEFAVDLHHIAMRNIEQYRSGTAQACTAIHPILSDAAQFRPPAGELVVLFHNPFTRPLMEKVLAILSEHKGAIRIISVGAEIESDGELGFKPVVRRQLFTIFSN
jgi:hypothetical protein